MLKIEYIRDGLTEEFHEGYWVCAENVNGISPEDNLETPYYLRSCAKPLQASLLIDYGIDLTPKELAFCCGSHAGEDCHIETAKGLLKKFNLKENMLKCGVHKPLSKSMQHKMILCGEKPTQLHNNCSGKHIGFLSLCLKNGWELLTYDEPEHPLQLEIKSKINKMCKVTNEYPVTTDGCGVPILSMPLKSLAIGYIELLKYPQILNAIKEYPYIYGGEDRTDTEIIQKTDNLIAKVGAGGLCAVLNIKEKNAFAVKINDASTEARRFALFEIIKKLGWGDTEYDNKIKTLSGKIVGKVIVTT